MDTIPYIPIDRRLALANGRLLPQQTKGAALFADIVGFTPLVRALVQEFGRKQGAEEVLNHLNPIYEALIGQLHQYGGSVIGFVGDAVTCWLPEQEGADPAAERAIACGLGMQEAARPFQSHLTIKVGIAAGPARRFLVGDPAIKQIDSLAGAVMGRMADAEKTARAGEVVVSQEVVRSSVRIAEWRKNKGRRFAVVHSLTKAVVPQPWAAVPPDAIPPEQLEAWVLPQASDGVYSDLRPIASMMIRFGGIDFDRDDDAGDKLDAFIRWTQAVIHEHGGALLQLTIGDKGAFVYAPFGAPRAYEDNGRRAMAAALALQQPPSHLNWLPPLQIGISQGDVWTGLCGAANRHTYSAIGSEVNLAARLMAAARPGQILTTGRIAQQRGFRTERLGGKQYKGFAVKIPTYVLLREETAVKSIFAAQLVGRESELQLLTTFAAPLQDKKAAGMAFIYGEAGMGKSHLAFALQMETKEQIQWFTGQTDGILRRPFNPFIHWLRRYFRQFSDASEQENKIRFDQRLANLIDRLHGLPDMTVQIEPLVVELQRSRSILGALLGLFWEESLYTQLNAQLRHENMITAVRNLLLAESCYRPTVFLLEDGQWLDATSRELLTAVSYDIAEYPLLILLTARYGDEGEKLELTLNDDLPVCTVELEGLGETAVFQQASSILQADPAPDLLTLLRQKTESNPFFVQQLLLHLQENVLLQQTSDHTWALTQSVKETKTLLPPTIDELLIARLDRLTQEVKGTVQTAAVLGHQFETRLLAEMLQRDLLAELGAAEKAQIWTLLNKLEYIFKHALLRDAAYDMQLRARLRGLHYLAATTGETLYADSLPTYYGALAYHYEAAYRLGKKEARDKARYYLHRAGGQAVSAYDNDNAIAYFGRAMALCAITDRAELYKALLARERIYNVLGEREAQAADLDRLTALADTIEEKTAVSLQYSNYYNEIADYEAALTIAAQAYQWAMESGDVVKQAQVMIYSGRAYMRRGEYDSAREQYQRAYKLSEASKSPIQIAHAWSGLGEVAYNQGEYATAIQYHEKVLTWHREIGNLSGQIDSLRNLARVVNAQGNHKTAYDYSLEALEYSRQTGNRPSEGRLLFELGATMQHQRKYPQATAYFQQALALAQASNDKNIVADILRNMAIIARHLGQYDEAMVHLGKSLTIRQEIGDQAGIGMTLNIMGAVAYYQGNFNQAAAYWEQSLIIAQEIGDQAGIGTRSNNLGGIFFSQGQYKKAIRYWEQSLSVSQAIGRRMGECITLHNLGVIFCNQERYDKAARYYEQGLAVAQDIESSLVMLFTFTSMGTLALTQSALAQAQTAYVQAVDMYEKADKLPIPIECWAGLALIALRQHDRETAQLYADKVVAALDEKVIAERGEDLIRTFYLVWQMYQELGMGEADKVLVDAAGMMQNYLDKQPDAALQAIYLQQPYHRPLWEARKAGSARHF